MGLTEGLNLVKKKPPIYDYQTRCYPNGDPHDDAEMYDNDECIWARGLQDELEKIVAVVPNGIFKIDDISLFDKYQGPYADTTINGKHYKIWTASNKLWIDGYPIDNTSQEDGMLPGYEGYADDIIDILTPANG